MLQTHIIKTLFTTSTGRAALIKEINEIVETVCDSRVIAGYAEVVTNTAECYVTELSKWTPEQKEEVATALSNAFSKLDDLGKILKGHLKPIGDTIDELQKARNPNIDSVDTSAVVDDALRDLKFG